MNTQFRNDIRGGVKGVQRYWLVTNAAVITPKRVSTIAHTAAVHGAGIIVITSTHATSLLVDDWVNITFTTNTSLTGRFRIIAVTSTTFTIKVRDTVADAGNVDSDIAFIWAELPFTAATVRARRAIFTDNTGDVYLGTLSGGGPDIMTPGAERVIAPTIGRYWDLADWYLAINTANDGFVITFD